MKQKEAFAMEEKIKLGISSCLLGENVRYDGGHKLDRLTTFRFVPNLSAAWVCPGSPCA
jgi:uncharacterized protein YbbK (DUF523 family)